MYSDANHSTLSVFVSHITADKSESVTHFFLVLYLFGGHITNDIYLYEKLSRVTVCVILV